MQIRAIQQPNNMRVVLEKLNKAYLALNCKSWTMKQAYESSQLWSILGQFYPLMHETAFLEILLEDGFKNIGAKLSAKTWTFASPFLPLLETFCALRFFNPENPKLLGGCHQFARTENIWAGESGVDTVLSEFLITTANDAGFLGTFSYQAGCDASSYAKLVNQIAQMKKGSAIVLLTDGTFAECLFYLKDDKGFSVITSTKLDGVTPSYLHTVTAQLIEKHKRHKLTRISSPGVRVQHDGNCTVYSEICINAFLNSAAASKSLYRTFCSLRDGNLSLYDQRVEAKDLKLRPQNGLAFPTLAALLSKLESGLANLGVKVWSDYCLNLNIHPRYLVKLIDKSYITEQYKSVPHRRSQLRKQLYVCSEINAGKKRKQGSLVHNKQAAINSMRNTLEVLAQFYAEYDAKFNYQSLTYYQAFRNVELRVIVESLYELMQDSVFFDVLFADGFESYLEDSQKIPYKAGVNQEEKKKTVWKFASPFMPLLHMYAKMNNNVLVSTEKFKEDTHHPVLLLKNADNPIFWVEAGWISTVSELNVKLGKKIQSIAIQDEIFCGIFNFGSDINSEVIEAYGKVVDDLVNSRTKKASAIVFFCDGTFVECLFYLKDEKGVRVLISNSNYRHDATNNLIKQYSIKPIICPTINVIHNGECATRSQFYINAVLFKTDESKHKSVYQTLRLLEDNQLDLNKKWVQVNDLGIGQHVASPQESTRVLAKTTQTGPNAVTLMGLLSALGLWCFQYSAKGWVKFCLEKSIHPFHAIKVPPDYLPKDYDFEQLQSEYLEPFGGPSKMPSLNPIEEISGTSLLSLSNKQEGAFKHLQKVLETDGGDTRHIANATDELRKVLTDPTKTEQDRMTAIQTYEQTCNITPGTAVEQAVALVIIAAITFTLGLLIGSGIGIEVGAWKDLASAAQDILDTLSGSIAATVAPLSVLGASTMGAFAVSTISYFMFFKPIEPAEPLETTKGNVLSITRSPLV